MTDEELKQFDRPFHEILDDMAARIDPKQSKHITRKGLGKIIDIAILLRNGFQQAWQFIVVIQALFIFLGLSPQVSLALKQLGISISGTMIGVVALGGIIFFFIFGLGLLLYGGTQRSNALISEKQAPAQRMNYHFYRAMSRWAVDMDKKLGRIESRLDDLEES